jgi:DNA polymerase-3 subunit beta
MYFTADCQLLSEGVQMAATATNHLNSFILLTADATGVTLQGNIPQYSIVTRVPGDVGTNGQFLFAADLLGDILKAMPNGKLLMKSNENSDSNVQVDILLAEDEDAIDQRGPHYLISALSGENFATRENVEELYSFSIKEGVLKKILFTGGYAHATLTETKGSGASRALYLGVLLEVDENGILSVVSLNGHRLAVSRYNIEKKEPYQFIVPSEQLTLLDRVLKTDGEKIVKVIVDERVACFQLENTSVVVGLIEGKFTNYKVHLQGTFTTQARMNTQEFKQELERVNLLMEQKVRNPLILEFQENKVYLSLQTSHGHGDNVVDLLEPNPKNLTIQMNMTYLLETLRHASSDEIVLLANTGINGVLLQPYISDANELIPNTHFILPIRNQS